MATVESLETFVEHIQNVPAFPTLWIPHCIMMSLALRATLGDNWLSFSRRHPMSCFFLGVMYTYPGGILSAVLLAQPSLAFLLNTPSFLSMVASWYCVFYSPFDLAVRLIDLFMLRVPLGSMQDFLRIQLVLAGVDTIHQIHPEAFVYPVVFAICKSSGFMFLKYAEYVLMNGVGKAFVIPHHSTKTCIVASLVFTAQALGYIMVDRKVLFAGFASLAVTLRLFTVISNADPYAPFENAISLIVFGATKTDLDEKKTTTAENTQKKKKSKKID